MIFYLSDVLQTNLDKNKHWNFLSWVLQTWLVTDYLKWVFCHLASSQEDEKWILSVESTLNSLTAITLGSTFYSSFCLNSKIWLALYHLLTTFSDLQTQKMKVPSCTQNSSHKSVWKRILEMHHYKSLKISTRGAYVTTH